MAVVDQTEQRSQAGSLEGELALLFGEALLHRARECDISELRFTPNEIVRAARDIRQCSADPAVQIETARRLPDDVQVAICKWIIDPEMKAKLLKATGIRLQ